MTFVVRGLEYGIELESSVGFDGISNGIRYMVQH